MVGPLGGLRVVTETHDPVQTLQESLKVDFAIEDDRFEYHEVLAGLFSHWLSERTSNAVSDALATTSLVWSRYRSFGQAVDALQTDSGANPMMSVVDQPGVGQHLGLSRNRGEALQAGGFVLGAAS